MHCFGIKRLKPPSTSTPTPSISSHCAIATCKSALCNIIEDIDTRDFAGREMLDAVRALAHLNENGRWIHHTSKSEVMYSMQRLPAVAGLPDRQAGLPPVQVALPARTNALSAAVDEEILIASSPNIRNRRKPLKTILTYSG
jgi:hypothetical protein